MVRRYASQSGVSVDFTYLDASQEHIKQQIMIKPGTYYRGYQQLGANVTRYKGGYQRDWHEASGLYREISPQVALQKTINANQYMPEAVHAGDVVCRRCCMQKRMYAEGLHVSLTPAA